MNEDAFLEAEMALIFNYPLQSSCFIMATLLVLSGLFLLTLTPMTNIWGKRAESLLFSGTLIAFPIATPLIMAFMGGNLASYPAVHYLVSVLYYVVPCIGAISGILGWSNAGETVGEEENV